MTEPKISKSERRWVLLTKTVIIALPLCLLGYLVNQRYILTPSVTSSFRPGSLHPRFSLSSGTIIRTAETGAYRWQLQSDTTSVGVAFPRAVPHVKLSLHAATATLPLVSVATAGQTFIAHAATLEALDWPRVFDGAYTIWNRPNASAPIATLADAVKTPDDTSKLAVAGFPAQIFIRPPAYTPRSTPLLFPHVLRGSHTAYAFTGGEDLEVAFTTWDRNQQLGPDPVKVTISLVSAQTTFKRSIVYQRTYEDNAQNESLHLGGSGPNILIHLRHPIAGLYRIEIATTDDILIENLRSMQSFFGFVGKIYFAQGPSFGRRNPFTPFTVLTNSSTLDITADHDPGLQKIRIGPKTVELKTIRQPVTVQNLSAGQGFKVEKGDLTIQVDDVTTLEPFQLPPRAPKQIDLLTTGKLDGIDHIIAAYRPHVKTNEIDFQQTISLVPADIPGKILPVTILAPGLEVQSGKVGFQSMTVRFERGAFPWTSIQSKLQKLFK